jgi:hypothetical protein
MVSPTTYLHFCTYGGLSNPRFSTENIYDPRGDYLYTIYLYDDDDSKYTKYVRNTGPAEK